jgi:thiamine biosynthesis lipoprotein
MRRVLVLFALLSTGCPDRPLPADTHVASAEPSGLKPATSPFVPEKVTSEASAMGTHLTFTAYTTERIDETKAKRIFDDAVIEIRRLETLMTTWRPDSEISRVNAAAGKAPVVVSKETYDVVAEALHAAVLSKGTFDITFESLHGLWKFDEDLDPHPPSEADVKAKLPLVNYRTVKLDPQKTSIFLEKEGVKIGLGGIAKGYAVDKAAAILDKAGLTSFFVQAGGDLFTRGKKPDGTDWQTGIRDPRGTGYFALVPVSDHAFSTAGDYERSYVVNGKRYHHIIDPRTGFPATACRSVTIWANSAFLADEIDDAVFILGPKEGLELVESLDGVGAVIVDAKNNLYVSKRLEGKLRLTAVPTDGI